MQSLILVYVVNEHEQKLTTSCRKKRRTHLEHHAEEGVRLEDLERHGDEVLVEEGGEEEDDDLGGDDGVAAPQDGLEEVADAPPVHRQVPRLPEHQDVVGVPPVVVELSTKKIRRT